MKNQTKQPQQKAKQQKFSQLLLRLLDRLARRIKKLKKEEEQSGANLEESILEEEKAHVKRGVAFLVKEFNAPIGHLFLKTINPKKHSDARIDYPVMKRFIYRKIQERGGQKGLPQSEIKRIKDIISRTVFKKMDQNIRSVVMIVHRENLTKIDGKTYRLKAMPLKDRTLLNGGKISSKNQYLNQLSANCLGTGFFIEGDIIATAAHVVKAYQHDLKPQIRFIRNLSNVRDIQWSEKGIIIKKEDIFMPAWDAIPKSCYSFSKTRSDWAIMKVISKTGEKSPIHTKLGKEKVEKEQELYCLGHGLGLPVKVSYSGKVIRINALEDGFDASLTIFSGNSGSPVFDAKTHKVVGILTRGTKGLHKVGNENLFQMSTNSKEGGECQILKPIHKALERLHEINSDLNLKTLINPSPMIHPNGPYTYFRHSGNAYELYLLIPVEGNNGIRFLAPKMDGDSKSSSVNIECQISDEPVNTIKVGKQRFAKKCYFFPLNNLGYQSASDNIEINISVVENKEILREGIMFLQDCDYNNRDNVFSDEELALNCPYAFLTNPHSGTDPDTENFDPHLLVPMKGYEYVDEMEKVHITNNSEGSCKSLIVLQKTSDENLNIIAPVKTNQSKFWDSDEIDGSFQAITYLAEDLTAAETIIEMLDDLFSDNSNNKDEEKNKKSKVKLRTRDADGVPLRIFGN